MSERTGWSEVARIIAESLTKGKREFDLTIEFLVGKRFTVTIRIKGSVRKSPE